VLGFIVLLNLNGIEISSGTIKVIEFIMLFYEKPLLNVDY